MRVFTRRRRAISELVASVLLIAITLITGFAVWGYVDGQAGTTEQAYGQSVGATANYLQEKFVVVSMDLSAGSAATVWLYNNGNVGLRLVQVRLYDSAKKIDLLYNYTVSGSTKTDYVYDLLSTSSGECKTAASTYETPLLSTVDAGPGTTQSLKLTIPPEPTAGGCPSFGQTFSSDVVYSVVVLAAYGNTVTFSQNDTQYG
ncbi:MAG: hypothetical protein JRN11_07935 [Nitrososphaerota archaeon]|nr:hypothetical protein [Nitrososphaerota archaeon]MDG6951553.1 hypothetical protein [Nitrososphaerota archaeon]MDG6987496.1 hypothetical protein [Nitrososphaerota archaeon]MDG6990158.1 hypothetical protein [Nitrososphaerota archaeon]MDG7026662.1 hypothetical protein [Nitrososphaerota archaeon]